jgi:hypothetical protein
MVRSRWADVMTRVNGAARVPRATQAHRLRARARSRNPENSMPEQNDNETEAARSSSAARLLESLAQIVERSVVACRVSSSRNGEYNTAFHVAGIVMQGVAEELRSEIEKLSNDKLSEPAPGGVQ